jgi:lysophospholipase L1-like esterase
VIDRSGFLQALVAAVTLPAQTGVPAASETPAAAERSFNVLILGDSIAWGQGLKPEHRWRTLLVEHLATALKCSVREISSEVHSGAIIGIGDQNEIGRSDLYQPGAAEKSFLNLGPYGGEIPSSTPTALAQLDALDAGADKDAPIDLVVVSAGINDVRIARFIDPLAREKFVADLVDLHCHKHLAVLLDRIRTRCIERNPACRVAVLSYFRIISEQSLAFPSVYDFVSAILAEPPHTQAEQRTKRVVQSLARAAEEVQAPPTTAYTSFAQLPEIVKRMIAAAGRFYSESETAIAAAVDDANRAPFSNAFVHVTPSIAPTQSLFVAPPNAPGLWEVRFDQRVLIPTDEVAREREPLCLQLYPSAGEAESLNECRIASFGHPDASGAQQGYFDALWAAIASVVKRV